MASTVIPNLMERAFDANGKVLPGAKMYWYLATTTTPTTVYTDYATTVPAANPVIADAGGLFVPLYAKDGNYKVVITDSSGTAIYTLDNYSVAASGGGGGSVSMPVVAKTANYTVQSTDRNTVFVCDASVAPGQNISITADSATLGNGFPFTVINSGAAGSTTIVGTGSQTVNGSASFTLSNQNQGANFDSNGVTGWVITGSTGGAFINVATFYALATFNSTVQYLEQTLVITSNIAAWDMSKGPDAVVTLPAATTALAAPTNQKQGSRGQLRILQDATGGRVFTWDTTYVTDKGYVPSLYPGINAETVFDYWCKGASGVGSVALRPRNPYGPHVILEDQKAANTAGQTVPANTDTQMILNTTVQNPYGLMLSLTSNQFILAAGTYYFAFSVPSNNTNTARSFLYNVTDAAIAILGAGTAQNATGVYTIGERSFGSGIITITAQKTFELRSRQSNATAAAVTNDGKTEIYSRVEITKLS